MLNLNPGQYDALEAVATRWQNEDQSLSETLGFSDEIRQDSWEMGISGIMRDEAGRKPLKYRTFCG